MAYSLGKRSKDNLEGVHPDLVKVVERAIEITEQDFTVVEGLRTLARQKILKARGASKTLRSRHIKAPNGYGHAVDLIPYPFNGDVDGDGIPNIEDWTQYHVVEKAMKQAAKELNVPIVWGGNWKSFKDGPHWQLPWAQYRGN